MNQPAKNLRDTIIPKSDQLNSEDLLTGPRTITVTGVARGSSADQPVSISFEGDNNKPYKPCKTVRKVLIFAWGDNGADWIGRSMTLYNDPDVKWGGIKVGGIRVSHLSDIASDISVALTITRGKKEPITIKRMTAAGADDHKAALDKAAESGMDALVAAWQAVPDKFKKQLTAHKDTLKAALTTKPTNEETL